MVVTQGGRFHASLANDDGRLRLLFDAITDYAIYMLDVDGRITSWNPGAQRFKGYRADEILGEHFSRFYTDEDRQSGLPARALAAARNEGRFEHEGWRVRKDGSRFWAHVIIDPVRTPEGQLVGFAKITRDLTDRKAAEDALRQSERQFRLLVEGVTDYAIFMLSPEGVISSWNPGAQRIKGYSADEIIGQHFSRFYTEEDRARGEPQKALQTAIREGKFEKEGWRVRKDGTRFWASVVIDAIRDDSGDIVGFAKVTRDFTEKREAQKQLELAREQLLQSQKLEAIGQLTGGIAHDFNNLLMAVLGSLELLRRRIPNDPKITRLLDNAVQGAERGTALTQRMLAFARRQELKVEAIDLPSLVRGMADLLQRSIGPTIVIDTRFPDELSPVLGDANQLELCLLNLAVNARDAMPEGGRIVIAAEEQEARERNIYNIKPGRYVSLSVTDTGIGMDDLVLSRAVEPFFTTKGPGKGTGIGLSMINGIAEQLGGRLVLKSRKGQGTTAEIWLPVVENAEPSQTGDDVSSESDTPADRPLVVLAVDDDWLVLMNTTAMLEELGHRAIGATSGSQALETIEKEARIDLVITDQAMPEMSGSDLAERLRMRHPDLPILLATGFAELPPQRDLPRLDKPFDLNTLRKAIAGIVDRRHPTVKGG